jgi:hypothetical protein
MILVQNDHVIEQLSADAPDPALGRSVLPRASKRRPLRGHLESLDRHCDWCGEDRLAIGHVRCSTSGCSELRNAQPFCATTDGGPMAIAHNGNLVNANAIRRELEGRGTIFRTGADSEVIVQLLARSRERNLEERLIDALSRAKGAYSLVMLTADTLIAARDPSGFRPLSVGRLDGAWVVAICICIRAAFLRDPSPLAAASFTTSRTPSAAARRSRLLPRAGLPPPVVVVPLGAAYRSFLSAAMHATAGAQEGRGADLRVQGGPPLVEPKTRTPEALLCGGVAGLHIRTPRSNPSAPLLPGYANARRHGVGSSSSTPGFVIFHG